MNVCVCTYGWNTSSPDLLHQLTNLPESRKQTRIVNAGNMRRRLTVTERQRKTQICEHLKPVARKTTAALASCLQMSQ